jgi:hypothetical protein
MLFLKFTCPRTGRSHSIVVSMTKVYECFSMSVQSKVYFKFQSFIRKRRRKTFRLTYRENLDDLKEWGIVTVGLADKDRSFSISQREPHKYK